MLYKLKNLSFAELLNKLAEKNLIESSNVDDYTPTEHEKTSNKFITFFTYIGSLAVIIPLLGFLNIDRLIEKLHFSVNLALGIAGIYGLAYLYKNHLPKTDLIESIAKCIIAVLAFVFFAMSLLGAHELLELFKFDYSTNTFLISLILCSVFYKPINIKVVRIVMLNIVFYTFLHFLTKDVTRELFNHEVTYFIKKYLAIVLFICSLAFNVFYHKFKDHQYKLVSQILTPALYISAIYLSSKYYAGYHVKVSNLDLYLLNIVIMALIYISYNKQTQVAVTNIRTIAIAGIILAIGFMLSSVISCLILLSVLFYQTRSSNFVLTMLAMPIALFQYYYALNQSLDVKAYILIASGILLLALIPLLNKKKENSNV